MTDACKRYTAWEIHKEIERGINFIDDFVYASDYAALQQQLEQAQGELHKAGMLLVEVREYLSIGQLNRINAFLSELNEYNSRR